MMERGNDPASSSGGNVMRTPVLMLSLMTAIAAGAGAALAQGQSTGQMPATMATYVCRPATPEDQMTNTSAMNAAHVESATLGNQKLVCMKLDRDAMMSESAKAKTMGSAAEADSSWVQYLQSRLNIPRVTFGQ
jgi:hypothetical protein